MIDWGNTPAGSKAQIYWPEVPAADVLALASRLCRTNLLSAWTRIPSLRTVNGVSYIPIPAADGKTFAGLFTVDLPLGVKAGQEFNIVVEGSRPQTVTEVIIQKNARKGVAPTVTPKTWRYVTGSVPRSRYRLRQRICCWVRRENAGDHEGAAGHAMSPSCRCYPVLKRVRRLRIGRVDGSGQQAQSLFPRPCRAFRPRARRTRTPR